MSLWEFLKDLLNSGFHSTTFRAIVYEHHVCLQTSGYSFFLVLVSNRIDYLSRISQPKIHSAPKNLNFVNYLFS